MYKLQVYWVCSCSSIGRAFLLWLKYVNKISFLHYKKNWGTDNPIDSIIGGTEL